MKFEQNVAIGSYRQKERERDSELELKRSLDGEELLLLLMI